jgi:hypothetical protein
VFWQGYVRDSANRCASSAPAGRVHRDLLPLHHTNLDYLLLSTHPYLVLPTASVQPAVPFLFFLRRLLVVAKCICSVLASIPCVHKSHLHTRAACYSLQVGQPTAAKMDDRNTPLVPSAPLDVPPIISREPYSIPAQVSVPTPTREPSFRKGAYTGNILRLEQSAERMSEGGSDIGEEIRKMNELEPGRFHTGPVDAYGTSGHD